MGKLSKRVLWFVIVGVFVLAGTVTVQAVRAADRAKVKEWLDCEAP